MPHIAHIALVVRDYDEAVAFYVGKLGFTLVEDTYQPAQNKRWVTIRPPGAAADATTILLARASTPEQERFIGDQAGGRVFLFLATDDFDRDHAAYTAAGVEWARPASNGRGRRRSSITARSPSSSISMAIAGIWWSFSDSRLEDLKPKYDFQRDAITTTTSIQDNRLQIGPNRRPDDDSQSARCMPYSMNSGDDKN